MQTTKTNTAKRALKKLQAICSKQEKCIFDARSKMQTWEIEQADIEHIIKNLVKNNFINEARYAQAFVNDKFKFNHWGRMKIAYALSQKKIPKELIDNALQQIPEEEYNQFLYTLLESKQKNTQATSSFELKKKLSSFAIGRGFESELVFTILDKLM